MCGELVSVVLDSRNSRMCLFDDFIRDNLAGGNRTTGDRLVPHCMFTDPRLAHVGLTEKEARRQGIEVRVAKLSMSAVLRTQTTGETKGFMKALVAAHDDRRFAGQQCVPRSSAAS